MMPILLALDTATETLALACRDRQGRTHGRNLQGGGPASSQIIPLAQALLAEAGLTLQDLDGIAFGQGPGAFTGLRTAVSVAQGLAFGLSRPVLPVCSLAQVAEDARRQAEDAGCAWAPGATVWVAMDARMDEAYAAAWALTAEGGWQAVRPAALYDLPTLQTAWQALPPTHLAGNAATAFAGRLSPPPDTRLWPDVADRAAALLALAEQAWAAGARQDPAEALPVYLRDKVALTTAEREAAAAAKAAAQAPGAAG